MRLLDRMALLDPMDLLGPMALLDVDPQQTVDMVYKGVDRFGLAPVLVLIGVAVGIACLWGLWQVIKWIAKRFDRVVDAHVEMTKTFSSEAVKHTTALETIAANDKVGHEDTHSRLDNLHAKVHEVHQDVRALHPTRTTPLGSSGGPGP